MRLPKRPDKLLANALLAAAVLCAAPDEPRAQAGADTQAAVRFLEGPSETIAAAQRQRARQARYHRRMAQADAHARMPDTMYASTPDPAAPPHPFPLDVNLLGAAARSGPLAGTAVRSALRQTHRIGLFPSAGDVLGRQGFARIINHSESDGEVDIVAWDDAGTSYGPVTLAIGAGETKHFNSDDLERGNAEKGLEGATGPPGEGDWRLELSSTLELQVLSYIRTGDGFLTSMHDVVARTGSGQHRVAIFNPGRNDRQVSRLRLVHPGAERTEVRIEGIDDEGQSPGEAVVLSLDGGTSRTLSAKELESGTGVSGMLGTGKGKWQLVVNADAPIEVLNTLSTPTGHLTNLSTAPWYAESDNDVTTTMHRIGLFPSAGDALGRQGFARIINHSDSDGEVDIVAWDDAGTSYGPVTLAIGGGETKHFNSEDLERGNASTALSGGVGNGEGNWRLELETELEIEALAYIRTVDGFLTSMHDVADAASLRHHVVTFNPGSNTSRLSLLRLINTSDVDAKVTIEGLDDRGEAPPGGDVQFTLPANAARTISSRQLEQGGQDLAGHFGDGRGKWQLFVSADRSIQVMSLLASQSGHLTNLSSASAGGTPIPHVTRGPYLQRGTPTSMTVRWRTNAATWSRVRYGAAPEKLPHLVQTAGLTTEHEVTLTGLAGDTRYFYVVGDAAGRLVHGDESYTFVTPPASGTPKPMRVWVLGDSGTADTNAAAVRDVFLSHTGSRAPDLWLMLGDNAYPDGTDAEYQAAVFDMYPVTLRQSVLWPTLGNHDGHAADSATQSGPYYDIFTLPVAGEAGGLASGTEAYYSFDYANVHFVCLDSHETDRSIDGAMMSWLAHDLAATRQEWIIAFWHHPPYSKGSHDSDTEGRLIEMRENALPLLESWGVDLVLTGHSHSYERSFLIDGHYGESKTLAESMILDNGDGREAGSGAYAKTPESGQSRQGAVYVVAGSSGKTGGGTLNHPAMFVSLNSLGSMVLDIYGNRLDAAFLDADGSVADRFTILKAHDTLPPVILSAHALDSTAVAVNFAEPVDPETAEQAGNYTIDRGTRVLGASLQGDGRTVVLATSPLTSGRRYVVRVNRVRDRSGNPVARHTQADFSFVEIVTARFQDGVFPDRDYSGTRDTFISEHRPDANFGKSGVLETDGDDPGGSGRDLSTLLAWDIASIPSNVMVRSASLTLHATDEGGVYHLHHVLRPWVEDGVTWNDFAPGRTWQQPGAQGATDRDSTVLGSVVVSAPGPYTVDLNPDGVRVVQGWVDGTIPNAGFILADTTSWNGLDLFSREEAVPTVRPLLSIEYPLAAEGGTGRPGEGAR